MEKTRDEWKRKETISRKTHTHTERTKERLKGKEVGKRRKQRKEERRREEKTHVQIILKCFKRIKTFS